MKVKLLNPEVVKNLYKNHGEFACECYATPKKYAEKVGKSCQADGHMSGSRCEYIKFTISDVDRGTAEQALRHEIGVAIPIGEQDNYSFSDMLDVVVDVNPSNIVKNMASFRYIDKDGFTYATPKNILNCEEANQIYNDVMNYIDDGRRRIKAALEKNGVEPKKATEDANFVLPRATTTSFTIGLTPEALIRFCHKRLCVRAQEFIREMAIGMKWEVANCLPEFATELVPHCQYLMWCPEGKYSCRAYPTKSELKNIIKKQKEGGKNVR